VGDHPIIRARPLGSYNPRKLSEVPLADRVTTSPANRRCKCGTKLSVYNHLKECALCIAKPKG